MKKMVDLLIINNCPSFYKINLYNEIAKYCKIHVIFIGLTNQVILNDSFREDILFDYNLLSDNQIEKRNKFQSIKRVIRILRDIEYKKIIYGGYADLEVLLLIWLTSKKKNCIQFESSIHESIVSGYKGLLKKIILSRFSIALPSGELQKAVFESLNYKGKIVETRGVGIFNKQKSHNIRVDNRCKKDFEYLFVGRLIPVKNIFFLIQTFNRLKRKLKIVGTGVLEPVLKNIAGSNITFMGGIPNNQMHLMYKDCDVLILPSISEPWGLVVEEAIHNGLPVIISDKVGCGIDLVTVSKTGFVFEHNNSLSLKSAIMEIERNYQYYKENVDHFDFNIRDKKQIASYLSILGLKI
jgi:glycosyltransferase involved in cell wall biosynthesis